MTCGLPRVLLRSVQPSEVKRRVMCVVRRFSGVRPPRERGTIRLLPSAGGLTAFTRTLQFAKRSPARNAASAAHRKKRPRHAFCDRNHTGLQTLVVSCHYVLPAERIQAPPAGIRNAYLTKRDRAAAQPESSQVAQIKAEASTVRRRDTGHRKQWDTADGPPRRRPCRYEHQLLSSNRICWSGKG